MAKKKALGAVGGILKTVSPKSRGDGFIDGGKNRVGDGERNLKPRLPEIGGR